MTGAVIVSMVVAVSGAVLGWLGYWRSRAADNTAAVAADRTSKNEERSVARAEFEAVVGAQRDLITELRSEVNDLRERLVAREHEVAELHHEIARCEEDKAGLIERVGELERTR